MKDAAFARTHSLELVEAELSRQDRMWGETNDRADILNGQLMRAAMAQLDATFLNDFSEVPSIYPSDWSGFRDYGSNIANLVVASAFLISEIRRRIRNDEDETRRSRDPSTQPYAATTTPNEILP